MMFPGSAPAGDHQETPPRPPLPSLSFSPPSLPPRALLQPNPFYSSTLSALAPPFTLDHVSLTPSLAPQLPPHPPESLLFPDFPTSRLLPHNDVAESIASRLGGANPCDPNSGPRVQSLVGTYGPTFYSEFAAPSRTDSAADVEPYFAHYYPDSQGWALDDLFGSSSAYSKLNSALLIKPVDEEAKRVKPTNEMPLTEVTEPPFSCKVPSFQEDSLLAYHPSNSQLPSHNTAADLLPTGSVSASPGHSYYAHYHHISELQVVNDSFGTSSAHAELGPAQCNKLSHEEIGRVKHADGVTRMEPNSSHTPSFQEGKEQFGSRNIEWLLDDHPPEKYEQDNTSYTIFKPQLSTFATRSTSAMGLHDTYISNSAYDRYMAQLDSCSMYPVMFYSSAATTEAYALPNSTSSTIINPTLSSVKVHHEVLPKVDDQSVIPDRLKEVNLHKNMDPKGGYDEKRWEDYNTTNSNVLPASSIRYTLPNNNHATESPSNLPSVLTSKLRLGNVVIADSSLSRCNSLDLNKSSKSSSEAFDQHNLAVDSPCWKGAPASQQFPFTIDGKLAVEYESFKNDSCHEHNQILGVGKSNKSTEQVGNLNFYDIKISPVSEKSECSPAVSSSIQQICEGAERKISDCRKDQENEILFDYAPREQTSQTNEVEKGANVQNVFPAKFVEAESNTANKFLPAKSMNENINGLNGPSSAPLKRMEELVKLIHGSSVELLSTNSSESKELKPHDYKLLSAAINNIALLLKDKEDIVGFHHCSSVRIACSCNKCLKTREVKRNNNIQNCNVKGKTLSGCNFSNDEFDNFVVKGGDADLSKVDKRMTQTIENALSQSFAEESRQASLYKNLWIQAEVLACRLKQELLIAQMKTESENYKPPQSDISSCLHSPRDLKVQDSPSKPKDTEGITEQESQFSASANHESSKAENVESSVMARFKILKDRDNNSVYRSTEAEYILDQEDAARRTGENATKNNSDMIANLADMGLINSVADEVRPSLHVSGYVDTRQMLPGPLNGSLIHSYMTHKQGSWPSTTEDYVHRQGSWPFEWEHVMREDESTHWPLLNDEDSHE